MNKRLHIVMAAVLTMTATTAWVDSPVADAASKGDLSEVRELLRRGADVNAAQGDGMTALHWASMRGDVGMTEVLLYAGAVTGVATRLGDNTPLHLAARNGNAAVTRILLEAGADPAARTSTGVTPLHLAARAGNADGVAHILAAGVEVDAVEDGFGQSPLHWAAAANRVGAMRHLIAAGADVELATEMIDYQLISSLDGADRRSRQELVVAAREAAKAAEERRRQLTGETPAEDEVEPEPEATGSGEADGEPEEPAEEEDAADEDGDDEDDPAEDEEEDEDQPNEDEDDEDSRNQQGSDRIPGGATQSTGGTTGGSRTGTAQTERPLSYNDLVGREGGLTSLHFAAREGHLEASQALLEAGADVDHPSGDGTTPILTAIVNGNYDLAARFLESGADPNLVSEDGVAPLFAALNNRWAPKAFYPQPTAFKQQVTSYLDLMELLLEAGADVNQRTGRHVWYTSYNFDILGVKFDGATAFWRAAYATDIPAMELLAAWGADPHIPTRKTPSRRRYGGGGEQVDPSGLPPTPNGGPAVHPIHAASGVGYGVARAGNSHRHVPDGWLPAVRYLVEVHGSDVNVRDQDGYSAVHHAAARGHNELIRYLVEKGADVSFVSRRGQTSVDMANGPQQRVQPFPETIALLEGLGARNNHNCMSC